MLIADDLRVRTRANVPLKGSESDGAAGGGGVAGGGQGVEGQRDVLPQWARAASETRQLRSSGPVNLSDG